MDSLYSYIFLMAFTLVMGEASALPKEAQRSPNAQRSHLSVAEMIKTDPSKVGTGHERIDAPNENLRIQCPCTHRDDSRIHYRELTRRYGSQRAYSSVSCVLPD